MAEELQTCRVTVRAALLRLQADNLLDIIPRSGAFVRSSSAKAIIGRSQPTLATSPELKRHGSFIRAMEAQGRHVHVRFLEPSSIMPAVGDIGAQLQTTPQASVLRRDR